MVNATDLAPARILAVAGTVTEDRLLARFKTVPPVGAGSLRVAVPVLVKPPTSDVGLNVRDTSLGGKTLRLTPTEAEPRVTVIFEVTALATGTVVAENLPVVAPAATVTLAGTVVVVLLLASLTLMPPVGASPERVKTPEELAPPESVVGLSVSELSPGV